MLLKNPIIRSMCHARVAVLVVSLAFVGCRGEGTFFSSILDDGGGFDSGFATDAGMDSSNSCIACENDSGQDGADASVPWASPFPNMGAPGFRNSTETLCADVSVDSNAIDVWSDDRGVFALVTGHTRELGDLDAGSSVCAINGCPVERLLRNDGNRWQLQREGIAVGSGTTFDAVALRGAIAGPLFVRRTTSPLPPDFCGLAAINGADYRCALERTRVESMFVVNANDAYAMAAQVLRFDGADWNAVAEPPPLITPPLWADASHLLAIDALGQLHQLTSAGAWDVIGSTPFAQASALWAKTVDDVWIGTYTGELFRFDGQAWQQMGSIGGSDCGSTSVRGIWGSGDSVYFYSARSLMRWNGSGLENLATWPCATSFAGTTIQDLWGNSENEVFIGLRDDSSTDTCGGSIVVHFDGTQFHRM